MLNISFVSKDIETVETIFVMVNHQGKMDSETTLLDNKHHGLISKTLQDKQKFKGKYGQAINLTTTNKQGEIRNIVIICIGDETKLSTPAHVEVLGGKIHGIATKLRAKLAALVINTDVGNYKRNRFAALIASGALLGSYRFEKYHTKKTEEQKFITEDLEIITEDIKDAETAFIERKAIAMGVFLARDCVNEAPNHFYP
ncbi:MAG: leucyl aminopeptidase, partial [Rickettsiaceae bacterium]|nr:leucyl aminopeptidase [Rickettsiaceae bacterium]